MSFTTVTLPFVALQAFYAHQATALPTNSTTPVWIQPRGSSKGGPNGRPIVVIIAVIALVLAIFSFAMIRGYLKRQRKKWGSTEQLQANTENSQSSPGYRPRTTASYSPVSGQTEVPQTETREVGGESSGTPLVSATRRLGKSSILQRATPRRRNGARRRTERPAMSEIYGHRRSASDDDTESTPLTNNYVEYTDTSPGGTPEVTRAGSNGHLESVEGSNASFVSAEEPESVDARVPTPSLSRNTANDASPAYRDSPVYDEACTSSPAPAANSTAIVPPLERIGSHSAFILMYESS
ncbi:hypothetical protein RhiXN_09041 [Rhizoctonia solani]|uniref:Uncharacterized protein n=1 Tax=Rhizoctonia solani TaxID=456999 RepID=A0A8H8SVL1_9AGAM|nr:uncharacterized protein RhiXN_09041 [Rhizoctonia solani]QRW20066.1 hypothetical protein RhiXN_09041 [Rhizoctonia solani]